MQRLGSCVDLSVVYRMYSQGVVDYYGRSVGRAYARILRRATCGGR